MFKDCVTPLQFARKGADALRASDERTKLFEEQRLDYGFAACDFWNFDCTLLTLIQSAANYMRGGAYPSLETQESWEGQLLKVAEVCQRLRDNIFGGEEDDGQDNEWLFDWLKENLHSMWI